MDFIVRGLYVCGYVTGVFRRKYRFAKIARREWELHEQRKSSIASKRRGSDASGEINDEDLWEELMGKYEQEDLEKGNGLDEGEEDEMLTEESEIVRMGKWAWIFRRAAEIEQEITSRK